MGDVQILENGCVVCGVWCVVCGVWCVVRGWCSRHSLPSSFRNCKRITFLARPNGENDERTMRL